MGFFSKLFGGKSGAGTIHSGKNSKWTYANRFNKARGGHAGGWGAIAFGNIVNAHSSPEEIVEIFELNKEVNLYDCDAYSEAYKEFYDEAAFVYEQIVSYYMELIEAAQSEIEWLESDIKDAEDEIEDLEQEIENLQDELEDLMKDGLDLEDFADAMEIQDDIAECREEIQELREQIEEWQERIEFLEEEIASFYDEIESTSIEELIDYDEMEKRALELACDFAQEWIDGRTWIPIEVLNWAYYDVSDHNW
jgi:predicted  nucleic acid-binding Zn-ribbon protein